MTELKKQISSAICSYFSNIELSEEELCTYFDVPPNPEMGDMALACFKLSKLLRKSPVVIAKELSENLSLDALPSISQIRSEGGYLNFFFRDSFRIKLLKDMLDQGQDYGKNDLGRGKTMVIDYSSPNIAKRFHIGHLGTTIIGNSIKKLHAFSGFRCVGINYLGDWGTQYGKLVVSFKHWGDEKKIREEGIDELNRLYVLFGTESAKDSALEEEARLEFHKLETGDEENLRLWKMFKEISLERYMQTYRLLDIEFDSFNGESFYSDKMPAVIEELREKKLLKIDQGASIVDLEEYNMPPCLILKRDGSSLYPTRDIAAALWRKNEYHFDKCIYVTSAGQSLHFAQWFKVVSMMGYDWAEDQLVHVPYGTFSINGEKIASRTGNVILLDDLFDEAIEKAGQIIEAKNPDLENKEEVAKAVGIGAIIFNSLLANRIKDVNFNWDEALNFDGNTGPYAQYTYSRACSVLKKCEKAELCGEVALTPAEKELVDVLALFPERVVKALREYEPSVITRYVLDVCQSFNRFYQACPVVKSQGDVRALRLMLCQAVKNVLGNALNLIGLRTPEKI